MNRILQIVQRPQRRGAEMFVYDLSRRFEEKGFETRSLYLYDHDGERGLPIHDSDTCLRGPEHHPLERLPGLHPGFLRRIAAEIEAFSPDIVQVNGSRTVKYGAVAKRLLGSRASWRLVYRNIGVPSDWHRWWGTVHVYRHLIMPQMDGIIGVSRISLEDARRIYRLRTSSTVILNGITTSRLEPALDRDACRDRLGVSDSDIVLLFVGYLEPAKRPDRFIRVVSRAIEREPRIRAWIVGDGPLRSTVERLAEELGASERISVLGAREDVATFMNAADLFVMTSDTEGVPAVVLEAGYLGLPVVATDVGGLSECVGHGRTGFLVDVGSEDQLAERILELASDESRREEMGRLAKEKVLEDFTIEQVAERYLDFYRQVLDQRRYAHA